MILDAMEMFQFNALKKKAAKYRPYDGTLTVTERSLSSIQLYISSLLFIPFFPFHHTD